MLLVFSLSLYSFSLFFLFLFFLSSLQFSNINPRRMNVCYTQRNKQITNNKRRRTTLSDRENCFRLNNFVHETYDDTRFWKKKRVNRRKERGRERKRLKALYDDAKNFELVDCEWSKYKSCWKENIKHHRNCVKKFINTIYLKCTRCDIYVQSKIFIIDIN